ncbi:Uncharacterized protein ABC855_g343 [[Candida] zeylanoides]
MSDYISDSESDGEGALLAVPAARAGPLSAAAPRLSLAAPRATALSSPPTSPDRTYNIDDLFSDITYASQIEEEHDDVPKSQPADHAAAAADAAAADAAAAAEDIENAHHLQTYLGFKQGAALGRRGLRDRSFANAHPYLADSAHYMGLASVATLNDMYRDSHDVGLIVKVLNARYMRYKSRYPRDDKYRAKNFYAILSKGRGANAASAPAGAVERAASDRDPSDRDPSDAASPSAGSCDSPEPDSFDVFAFPEELPRALSPASPSASASESSDSDEDVLVRVGGRLIKERSILHGTLPESAKRLAMYQPQPKRCAPRRVVQYRKGLAVKKRGHHQTPVVPPPVSDVSDASGSQSDVSGHHQWPVVPPPVSGVSDASESHSDVSSQETVMPELDWEVIEEDRVDPMFANTTRKRLGTHSAARKRQRANQSRAPRPRQSILFGTARATPRRPQPSHRSEPRARVPLGELNPNMPRSPKQAPAPPPSDFRDLFKSRFHFTRDPVVTTTTIEAESDKRYVPVRRRRLAPLVPRASSLALRHSASFVAFPPGFILSRFRLNALGALRHGYTKITHEDRSIGVNLLGVTYLFSLLDKSKSHEHVVSLLRHLERVFARTIAADLEREVYDALGGLIEWALTVQTAPVDDDPAWGLVTSVCGEIAQDAPAKLLYYPYLVLLLHIWHQAGLGQGRTMRASIGSHSSRYFKLLFESFDAATLVAKLEPGTEAELTMQFESLYTLFVVVGDADHWWVTVDDGLKRVKAGGAARCLGVLQVLAESVAPRGTTHSWDAFMTLYDMIASEAMSCNHDRFLDLVLELKDRFRWPLDEKIITLVYHRTITARKFANFDDEIIEPQLIGRIVTRDSLPDSSFFDRFMYLVYTYISESPAMEVPAKKKRLLSKLFTSSQFHYASGPQHYAMYVNRFNFILLFMQLNQTLDLKGQVADLVSQVLDCEDLDYYRVTASGLQMFFEIKSAGDLGMLPVASYAALIAKVGQLYRQKKYRQCADIWTAIKSSLRRWMGQGYTALVLSLTAEVAFADLGDSMLLDLNEMLLSCLRKGCESDTLEIVLAKNYALLQAQMSRLPLEDEAQVTRLVEVSLQIWIWCHSLDIRVNWNELIFQRFPYMGNAYSRSKFGLFFHRELLNFVDIGEYLDTYLMLLLECLVPNCDCSYQGEFFSALRDRHTVLKFAREIPQVRLSDSQFNGYKYLVLSGLISNIVSGSLSQNSKDYYIQSYIGLLLKSLNETSAGPVPRAAYTRAVEILSRHALAYVKEGSDFRALTRKLGLSQLELDVYAWPELIMKQKLTILHSELVASLANGDVAKCLARFVRINGGDFDLLYHLTSVYMKAVAIQQYDKWALLCATVTFITEELKACHVNLVDGSFARFIVSMVEMGFLRNSSTTLDFYQQSLRKTAILMKTTFLVLDGYKDQIAHKEHMLRFIENYNEEKTYQSGDDFKDPYSTLRPFDVSIVSGIDGITPANLHPSDEPMPELLRDLADLVDPGQADQSQTMEFDL